MTYELANTPQNSAGTLLVLSTLKKCHVKHTMRIVPVDSLTRHCLDLEEFGD